MKIRKLFKRATALALAAVTALSAIPATTAFAAGDIGTISFTHTYDGAGNAIRYNSSANIGGHTAGGTGEYKYRMYVDGETAFCLQPGVPLKTGNTLAKASSNAWNSLSAEQNREFRVEDQPKKQSVLLKKVGDYEKPDDFTLEKAFKESVVSENILYFKAADYDNNGAREAFGITGNCDQHVNLKIYFINQYAQVSCIDEIEELWVDETDFEDNSWLILDTGQIKFLRISAEMSLGATFLYGVKGVSCYQPEISGKHAAFYRNEDGTYNGHGHEGPGYRYIYEYNPDTGEFDYIDREWVGARVLEESYVNIKAFFPEYMMENMSVAVSTTTENLNGIVKTASYTNLLPNETYNFYVMRLRESDNKFSKDNLLYIQQMESDREGRLSIEYSSEYIPNVAEEFLVAKTQTDISDAQVTMPKLTYNGKEQYVQPTITLGDKRLIEGKDYEIAGTYSAFEVGHYKVTISGMGLYTGVLDAEYQIEDAQIENECNHKYVWITDKFPTKTEEGCKHQECILCGDKQASVKISRITNSNNNDKNLSYLGKIYLDANSKAIYKVTRDDVNARTVSYLKTKVATGTLNVPDSIKFGGRTYKVTEIGNGASANNTKITRVIIGKNVTSIGQSAFSGCRKLKMVTIGKNVISIKKKAFSNCVSLKSIVIPSKVKIIGSKAFYKCKNLKKFTIKTIKLTGKSIGSKAFSGVFREITVKVPKSKMKSYKTLLKKKGIGIKAKIK